MFVLLAYKQRHSQLLVRSRSPFGQPDFNFITTAGGSAVAGPVGDIKTWTGTKKQLHATGKTVHHEPARPFILEFNPGRFFQLLQSPTKHSNADGQKLFQGACWKVYDDSLHLGPRATVAQLLAQWTHGQSGDQGVRLV
ncbi:hypothetical protein PCANC_07698 [Puccinia coronata f. sp. avenae]|uniref:Uncharacterized protein n=1 Tax=Puccinia coronata f. sp. avenae TaxID=200324 RepID=A0A2N5VRG1_9BASI|nr:hypothetical protein PCANC_07698 [Puccinia coronata f. sp. avenae]